LQALFSAASSWLNVRTPALYGYGIWKETAMVHRVGIGRLDYSRRNQDADLEIVLRFSAEQKRGDTCWLCKSVMLAQFGERLCM
jgi:hypothetical protein